MSNKASEVYSLLSGWILFSIPLNTLVQSLNISRLDASKAEVPNLFGTRAWRSYDNVMPDDQRWS